MRTWRQKKGKPSDYTRNKGQLKAKKKKKKKNLRPKSTSKKYIGKFILPSSPWGDKNVTDKNGTRKD